MLFGALLIIVVGSLTGEWLSIKNKLSDADSFLWGHQGYEYVDLGRVWQVLLFVGLLIWLFLIVRSVRPALKTADAQRPLLWLFLISAAAIGLFYGAGLMWGQHTHLSIVEYWRWWVVHLWVEGFFEVFATTVIAFFFTRLGLIRPRLAAKGALLSATIFLSGGIIGTCHHLYFSGTPTVALAWGSVFSALEVVPLTMVAYSALDDLRRGKQTVWTVRYKWPIYFFVAVAFWNMVGAGLFGFMINPPIALYFMQGLNTTPLHGHAALFGVYGMLGIGLMLVCLRAMSPDAVWKERWLRVAFWGMNGGLMMMCIGSLLPVGLMQSDRADPGVGSRRGRVRHRSFLFRRHHERSRAPVADHSLLRARRGHPGCYRERGAPRGRRAAAAAAPDRLPVGGRRQPHVSRRAAGGGRENLSLRSPHVAREDRCR